MKKKSISLFGLMIFLFGSPLSILGQISQKPAIRISDLSKNTNPGWKLIWADEFNYNGLPDSSKWSYDTKGNAGGWGIKEEQYYTDNDTSLNH